MTLDVRPRHREAVTIALQLVRSYLANELSTPDLVERFTEVFYGHALDGHEDPEGSIPLHDVQSIRPLRVLYEVERIIGLIFDDSVVGLDVRPYLDAGRIPQSDVRSRIHEALARVAVDLSLA